MFHRVLRLVTIFALALTVAGQAHAQSGWWKAGGQTIQISGEAVSITLDGSTSASAVRIEARQGRLDIQAVIVRYGAGRVVVDERPIRLAQGERTRPVELGTRDEPLQAVEIVLAPGQSGAATVEVWTRAATAPASTRVPDGTAAKPVLKRDPVTGEWKLGTSKVGAVGFERDEVGVEQNPGFKSISLEAKGRAVTVDQVAVTYEDGTSDTVPLRTRLETGQKQTLDVPRAKPVKTIAVKSRSRIFDHSAKGVSTSGIEITGMPVETTAAVPPRAPDDVKSAEPPRTRGGGPGGGVVAGAPSSEPRSVQPGEPKAVSEGKPVGRTSYSYSLSTLDACVADKSCTAVPVFFGTDRNQGGTQSGRITFGTERAGRLQLGRVYVTVPSNNRHKGQLNVPGTVDWLRGTPEGGDPKRHFTIPASGITLYGSEAEFLAAVREHVASGVGTFKDHAFVFVHGYRTPWEFAAMRTAQIAYDLSPDDAPFGTPFLYSWPSQGAAADYITDLDNSRIAIPHLVSFLRTVVEKTGASNVHVIAHSMGNFPVMHALAEIARTAPGVKFSQVVLAAPDVEKKEFEDVAKSVVAVAKGVTLYASSSDIALLVSRLVRRDKPRAGDAKDPPGPAVVEGMDTVDISRLSTGFMSYFSWNHDKYADSPVLLNDISTLFRKGERPPSARNVSFRMYQARFWRYED